MRGYPLNVPTRSWSLDSHMPAPPVGCTEITNTLLVVVRDLHVVGPVLPPNKTNTVLIVDSDAVLTFPVTLKRFQPVSGRDSKVIQINRRFNLVKLAQSHNLDRNPTPIRAGFKELLRIVIFEALNHVLII
jgi:hypothetical protein